MKRRDIKYLQMLTLLSTHTTPRGRKSISVELKVGEGVARALLEGGRELGHLHIMKGGVKITDLGTSFLREVLKLCGIVDIFPINEARELLCGKKCMAYVIADRIDNVLETRDKLVSLGACGALIIENGENPKLPPSGEPLSKYSKSIVDILRNCTVDGSTTIVTCGEVFVDTLGMIELKCGEFLKSSDE